MYIPGSYPFLQVLLIFYVLTCPSEHKQDAVEDVENCYGKHDEAADVVSAPDHVHVCTWMVPVQHQLPYQWFLLL